ncbi:micrococcal nuclease [Flammeovirgaceae bacterium 311]|nr:micrococcal nuclease [Flammeovirgaceae bacterium 311]
MVRTLILIYVFSCMFLCASAQKFSGRVVGVSDGDTFTLLTNPKKQIKVRLAEIDTPESKQPYGTRAKQALSDLIFNKDVTVEQDDIDRYGRLVGHVYVGDVHVNPKLVQQGMAWVYRQYIKDQSLLMDEQVAREAKCGIWSLPSTDQVPPWEWRRGNRKASYINNPDTTPASSKNDKQQYNCGSKTKCSEITSCKEALFYLRECGLTRLDGDGDGVPCEGLCK